MIFYDNRCRLLVLFEKKYRNIICYFLGIPFQVVLFVAIFLLRFGTSQKGFPLQSLMLKIEIKK